MRILALYADLARRGRNGDMEALLGFWYSLGVFCLFLLMLTAPLNDKRTTFSTEAEREPFKGGWCAMVVRMNAGELVFNSNEGNLTCYKLAPWLVRAFDGNIS